ncbi:acyltransferase family protein [archaeon BMS3Bbin16]|nr:acyltransferase family protein [archaeon BMS3Bbin16]
MGRKHLEEITLLRGLAIIGVVAIHSHPPPLSLGFLGLNKLYIEELSKFSVPLFIFISGLVLTFRYTGETIVYTDFLKRRFEKILIPYLAWSGIYLLYRYLYKSETFSLFAIAKKFLIGSAYFHLYYVFLILQFYLLFPLFLRLIQRFKNRKTALLSIAAALNLIFIAFYESTLLIPERLPRRIFIFWIFYFILGAVIGGDLKNNKRSAADKISYKLLIPLFAASLIYLLAPAGLPLGSKLDVFWLMKKTFFYAALFILLSYKLASESNFPTHNIALKPITSLGKYSLGIYLAHLIILEPLSTIILNRNLLFILTLSIAWFFTKTVSNLPYGHLLVGKINNSDT